MTTASRTVRLSMIAGLCTALALIGAGRAISAPSCINSSEQISGGSASSSQKPNKICRYSCPGGQSKTQTVEISQSCPKEMAADITPPEAIGNKMFGLQKK